MELPYLASSEFTSTIQFIGEISECTASIQSVSVMHAQKTKPNHWGHY